MGRHDRNGRHSRARESEGQPVTSRQILDRFTSVDDLIEQTNQTLSELEQTQRALATALDEQTELEVEVEQRNQNELPYDLSQVVPEDTPTNSPETVEFEVPKDGTLTRVLFGWPDGAQQALGIGLRGTQGEQLIPRGPSPTQFTGLNDKTVTYEQDYPVQSGETLTVRYANNDPEQEHFANVILFITED